MKEYTYEYAHDDGSGDGTIQAESKADALAKLKAIYAPNEDEGAPKLKNLTFEIKLKK